MKAIKISSVRELDKKACERLAGEQRPALELCKEVERNADIVFMSDPDVLLLGTRSTHNAKEHALVHAAGKAYNWHVTLQLKPDDIWLTIAQGIAEHINADDNAEKFRSKFVSHEGKKELVVTNEDNHDEFVRKICDLIEKNVKNPTLQRALVCDFTTTTPAALSASRVVVMAAMKNYFSYKRKFQCGIPSVILEGTLQDWERILEKVEQVQGLGLELDWWLNELKPVLHKLVDTYKGIPDEDFWSRIITSHGNGSGRIPDYSGWIVKFFPYSRSGMKRASVSSAIKVDNVPQGMTSVPFVLDDNGRVSNQELRAGFLGCKVDLENHSVMPHIGWMITK